MCTTIYSTSVHCDIPEHTEIERFACKKMWGLPWYAVFRCKKMKHRKNESAEECKQCRIEGPRPVVQPWLTEEEEQAGVGSSRETTPDSWDFSEDRKDNEDSGLTVEVDEDSHWSSDEPEEDASKTK